MSNTLRNGRQPILKTGLSPFWRPSSVSLKTTNISWLLSLNAIRERVGPSTRYPQRVGEYRSSVFLKLARKRSDLCSDKIGTVYQSKLTSEYFGDCLEEMS
jgi:hypothetical protein